MAKKKLSKKRFHAKQAKSESGNISKYVQWYDPEKHHQYIFMAIARVSSWQQFKNLFRQLYRIQTFVSQEKLKLIDKKVYWIIQSAFWSVKKRERAEYAEIESIVGQSPLYNPNRPYYKPHYKQLEYLKIKMGNYPNAAFLFESLDRAVRADDYSFEDKDAELVKGEVIEFAKIVYPYPVILLCPPPPDATANKIGEYYKSCDEGFEDSELFREYELLTKQPVDRLERHKKYYYKVIRLRFTKGLGYKQIFEKLEGEVKKSCIERWCQKYQEKQ